MGVRPLLAIIANPSMLLSPSPNALTHTHGVYGHFFHAVIVVWPANRDACRNAESTPRLNPVKNVLGS